MAIDLVEGTQPQNWTVERKGLERVPAAERHGRPNSVFTLWFAANVEFATLVTGVLATAAFGLGFAQALLAIVIGNVLGAVFLGVLSAYGPTLGVPQLVQSRRAFGYYGNMLPGALTFIAGFSWFAVNTVLGVFALEYLVKLSFALSLAIMAFLQILIAVYGHDLIHTIEKGLVLVLTVIFAVVSFYAFAHGHLGTGFSAKTAGPLGFSGAFIFTVSVTFSYVLGWIPYSSDYTRYLPEKTSSRRVFLAAASSMLISGIWLEALGAALGTVTFLSNPTGLVTGLLPHVFGIVAMIGVVLGTVTANVLNIYSGALSGLVVGVPMPRWLAAIIVGGAGTAVAWFAGQHNYWEHYENFLLLLGYWVAPWAAVLVVDHLLNRGRGPDTAILYRRSHVLGWGFLAWTLAIAASVPFMNQTEYVGAFASGHPRLGDITYYVGFVVALVLAVGLGTWSRSRAREHPRSVDA